MKNILIFIIFIWLILPIGNSNSPNQIIRRKLSNGYSVYSVVELGNELKLVKIKWLKGSLIKISWDKTYAVIPFDEYIRIQIGDLFIYKGDNHGR